MSRSVAVPADLDIPLRRTASEVFDVNDRVQQLFTQWLAHPSGEVARKHLRDERALPDDFVRSEGLGYCGRGRTTLVAWARREGISLELLAEAGLVKRSIHQARRAFRKSRNRDARDTAELSRFWEESLAEQDEYYHNYPSLKTPDGQFKYGCWITIPIRAHDEAGQVRIAGFQFRSARPKHEVGRGGRYRSPRPSQVLDWKKTLIGLAEESEQILRSGEVVLCEGKFDQAAIKLSVSPLPEDRRPGVIALGGITTRGMDGEGQGPEAQAGVLAVLAHMGVRRATLWLDEDERGTEAILGRGADDRTGDQGFLGVGPRLAALGIHVSVARQHDAWDGEAPRAIADEGGAREPKDASELYLACAKDGIQRVLERSRGRGLITFASAQLEGQLSALTTGGQIWQRLRALDRIAPTLKCMPDNVRRSAARRVMEVTGLPGAAIAAALGITTAEPGHSNRRQR